MQHDEIVFEDLHGANADEPVTVDLDAELESDGIQRTPAAHAAVDDAVDDDDDGITGLHSADDSALEQDDEPTDAIKASEDDDYSKKVKARISRATRATKKESDRADYWETQAKALATGNYDRDKQAATSIIEQSDSQIETTLSQLDAAIEAGNTKDQVRLTSLLTDQKAAKIRAEVNLENLSPDGNVQPFDDRVAPRTPASRSETDKWVDSTNDWYGAKGFERQTRLANRLDKEVFADGFDPKTPEYFEELDTRIKAKEPSLYDDVEDVAKGNPPPKRPARSPVAGVDTTGNRQRSSSSKVELTERDFAVMREFNLDPKDPEVLKEFARNKREANQGAAS